MQYPNINIKKTENLENDFFYILRGFLQEAVVEELSINEILSLLECAKKSRYKYLMALLFSEILSILENYRIIDKFNKSECNRFHLILEIKIFPIFESSTVDESNEMKIYISRYCDLWKSVLSRAAFSLNESKFLESIESIQNLYKYVE